MQECYSKEGTEDGPRIKINIVSDELALDIGQPPEGWTITPLVSLKVGIRNTQLNSQPNWSLLFFILPISCFVKILIATMLGLRFPHFKWSSVGKEMGFPKHYITRF